MDYLKYKDYLAHAGQLSYTSTVKKRSGSRYKGGFVNGKNTPAYNHDYYIHNKDKWYMSKKKPEYTKLQDWWGTDERDEYDRKAKDFRDNWLTIAANEGQEGLSQRQRELEQLYRIMEYTPRQKVMNFVDRVKEMPANIAFEASWQYDQAKKKVTDYLDYKKWEKANKKQMYEAYKNSKK